MAGDFSRKTFDRKKNYAAVQAQQGRVITDADLNEEVDIGLYRTEVESIDVIGACGVPKAAGGFEIGLTPDGKDLTISPGRIYVDGCLCELNATPLLISFPQGLTASQAAVPELTIDQIALAAGQWVEIFDAGHTAHQLIRIVLVDVAHNVLTFDTDISSFQKLTSPAIRRITTYLTQPDYPDPEDAAASPPSSPPGFETLSLPDGQFLAYLRVWRQEVTALDDTRIREVALGGPDTSTRLKTVWQLKLLKVTPPGSPPSCSDAFPEWVSETASSTGRLNAKAAALDKTMPCSIPPKSGFRGLENQLYRVEIHRGGDRTGATFKWSRENASVTSRITVNGNTIVAESIGKDDTALSFQGGNWVEILDAASELKFAPHDLFQIDAPNPATREIPAKANISNFSNQPGLKLRRWDQVDSSATANGLPMSAGWQDLESGIQVSFSEGLYKAGDYWLIPARTATGDIEWPPFEVPNIHPIPESPHGVRRHYCRLALFDVLNSAIIASPQDCRRPFPPLTAIAATDVSYDPGCQRLSGTQTVQQALDILCQSQQGICTFVAVPGQDVQQVFDRIQPGTDAEVCFPAGTYTLSQTVVVLRKGHLRVSGTGSGTRFIAPKSQIALLFESCASVSISDLYAETGVPGAPGKPNELNGTLTLQNCQDVNLERVELKCAPGASRTTTCLTVANPVVSSNIRSGAPAVRVRACNFQIGNLQVGMLLVNTPRCQVEDNVMYAPAKPASLGLDQLVLNPSFRAALRKRLIGNPVFAEPPAPAAPPVAAPKAAKVLLPLTSTLRFGGTTIQFNTPDKLANQWQQIVLAHPPAQDVSPRGLLKFVKNRVDELLVNPDLRATVPALNNWFNALRASDRSVAFQGIVIAGQIARDIRVLHNTIEGVLQGIHIGVSHKVRVGDPLNTRTDIAGTIAVSGNTVEVVITQDSVKRERHGIFVGNCNSLSVENNNLRLTVGNGAADIPVEASRIHGYLGKKVVFKGNHATGFAIGLSIFPRFPYPAAANVLWLVSENVFESVPTQVRVPAAPHGGAPITVQGNAGP